MSVNLSYGISSKKTKHLGNYFSTIDFFVESCSKRYLEAKGEEASVGEFVINGSTQKISLRDLNYVINNSDTSYLQLPSGVTLPEKNRIIETFNNAKVVFWQKVRTSL